MWFEFITNTKCNWNCEYCSFDRVEEAWITPEKIQRHQYVYDFINSIEEKTIVLEGGEIGLIENSYLLKELILKFNQKVVINTNGTFFDQPREMLYDYIESVFLHVAPDAKEPFRLTKYDVPFEVIYGLVDDDPIALHEFDLMNRESPKLGYMEYEFINEEPTFDVLTIEEDRRNCYTLNPFMSIDLAREVLCPCTARGCHITIPLNETNFHKLLSGFNNFLLENDMCETCYRICRSFAPKDVIHRKLKCR